MHPHRTGHGQFGWQKFSYLQMLAGVIADIVSKASHAIAPVVGLFLRPKFVRAKTEIGILQNRTNK